jgi:uncharacterized protein
MKILCEVVVSDIMPTLRALVTGDLMRTYGFNQVEVSGMLGITQPAVSQYRRGLRGSNARKIESNKPIMALVRKLTSDIATKKISPMEIHTEMCKISELVVKGKLFGTEDVYPGPCSDKK